MTAHTIHTYVLKLVCGGCLEVVGCLLEAHTILSGGGSSHLSVGGSYCLLLEADAACLLEVAC